MSVAADAEAQLAAGRPAGVVVTATDLVARGDHVAFSAGIPAHAGHEPVRRVAVVDRAGRLTTADPTVESHGPQWSPDGTRLAWIVARGSGSAVALSTGTAVDRAEIRCGTDDVIEAVRWSPDGRRLLLRVAEPGAQLSDTVGSGVVPAADDGAPGWQPSVETGPPTSGWRRARTYDLGTGALTAVSPPGVTVWQAEWRDDDRVVLIASDGPTESDWYAAFLAEVDLADGSSRRLSAPAGQLARVACAPTGSQVSVIVGPMSDRGIDVGSLALDGVVVDLGGVHVTDQSWTGPDEIVFAGLRGLRTVVGRYRPGTGAVTTVWESDETCGGYGPEVAATPDRVMAWTHGYAHPPALVDLAPDTPEVWWRPTGTAPAVGRLERTRWHSPDGTVIEGLLVLPDGDGPFPLIVHLHGGPVWAWRDEWSMHYPLTPLLVRRGFAVLHPNHRASSGRGAEFVTAGLRDLGGVDADDIVSGVDALITSGRVDATRIGLTGNSYGGFMTAWLAATTDRFAAVAARSPVTDWVSQHLTSNLPAFDELCLPGPVLGPESEYLRRSPLHRSDGITAPVLLVAGRRDLATPPDQAVMLHRALVERGHPSTLVLYPEEGHGVRAHDALVDLHTRLLDHFESMPAPSR